MPKRVNTETGIIEEQKAFCGGLFSAWEPAENSNGNTVRVNTETGVIEEEKAILWGLSSTWEPLEDSGRPPRVDEDASVYNDYYDEPSVDYDFENATDMQKKPQLVQPEARIIVSPVAKIVPLKEEKKINAQEYLCGHLKINRNGCHERVNLLSGIIEERSTALENSKWKPRLNESGRIERVDLSTGKIEERKEYLNIFGIAVLFGYTNRFRDGYECVDLETGIFIEKNPRVSRTKINENHRNECMNFKTGMIEEPDCEIPCDKSGSPILNENKRKERICPKTGLFQEHDLVSFFWTLKLNGRGCMQRINVVTDEYEVFVDKKWLPLPLLRPRQ